MTLIQTTETAETTWSGLPVPEGWHIVERREDGLMWQRLFGEAIKVIESVSVQADGRRWLHVSVSKPKRTRLPSYEDLQSARRLFIGAQRECYQVFPSEERYVNLNPVLHLFCCLDAPEGVLPRFEGMICLDGQVQLSV